MAQSIRGIFFLIFVTFFINVTFSQTTQEVRGSIFDAESHYPITGVKIMLDIKDTLHKFRALSSIDGNFIISNVPIGKYEMVIRYLTYESKTITIEVNSGKQLILEIPLQESFLEQEEVTVSARKQGEVINELALLSAQQFSVEETNRYAGSRSDPARMASNFAGVGGSDDSRNDIVIRGNSPLGVLWRVEGIDIPNPSHFAISGSTGGPVSILNNKILGNSDFFMSAFPAEYGNSTSGVFDLKLRNGNNDKHELTAQFGFLGTELMAEGPLTKSGNSSYLVMGRYSTLSLFEVLGVNIGTDAVPKYGDGAFKMNWRLKNGGALSFFAIGGASDIDILISDKTELTEDLFGEGDRDQFFSTAMLVTGLSFKKPVNEKSFIAATLAYSHEQQTSHHDFLIRSIDSNNAISIDDKYKLMDYKFATSKISGYFSWNHKLNKRHLIKTGINLDYMLYNMIDSALQIGHSSLNHDDFTLRWDYQGNAALIQSFFQWKWKITEKMAFTAGVHNQYYSLSNSYSILEPRLGWKLKLKNGQAISAAAGMHSQTQPQYTYLFHQNDAVTGEKKYHNITMDFTRSVHSGIGYEKAFKKSLTFKSEAYYQHLYNVPVTISPSSFSMINSGGGFSRFFPEPLENTGTGYNYGIEVTLQKYFSKSYFFLLSATLYDSKYRGSDEILRNTSYNGLYIANLLAGKEFKINEKQSITIGGKITVAGGKRYGYVNIPASLLVDDIVFLDDGFNERQFYDYFRADIKINWKLNGKKTTHEIGLDLVNIFNSKNLLSLAYAPNLSDSSKEPISEKQQLGFLPIFYYKVDLRIGEKK